MDKEWDTPEMRHSAAEEITDIFLIDGYTRAEANEVAVQLVYDWSVGSRRKLIAALQRLLPPELEGRAA